MDQSSEKYDGKMATDEGEVGNGQSDRSRVIAVDDELDRLPVFGTEEDDWDINSSSNQKLYSNKDRNSDNNNESQDGVPISDADEAGNSTSGSGTSDMDDERVKNSENNPITPLSDNTSMDVQDAESQTGTETSQSGISVSGENKQNVLQQTSMGCTDKETLYTSLIRVKDEPIDEDYDKALLPQSDISRVKQEMDNSENESAPPSDELRISSVFSVSSGAIAASVAASQSSFSVMSQSAPLFKGSTLVLPAPPQPHAHAQLQLRLHPRPQMHPQIQSTPRMHNPMLSQPLLQQPSLQQPPQQLPQPPPQPPPQQPPSTVRICCSGCSKVLQKGQTAFQRKGSNQLFCSTVCLTSFSLPSVQISPAPKKTCQLCLKVILNPKDLITIPVGSSNTLKEFCSLVCLSIYKDTFPDAPSELAKNCSVCMILKEVQHEVTHMGSVHSLCSDDCFARFRSTRNLYMSFCENCGKCTASGNYHLVQVEDSIKKFCRPDCISTYKQKTDKRIHCPCCQAVRGIDQMIEGTNIQGVIEFFCSPRCLNKSQASPNLTGASFPCTACQKKAVPQYHLAIADGSIRNFCSFECVGKFQEKLRGSEPHSQMNGDSASSQYNSSSTALRELQNPNTVLPPRLSTDHHPPTNKSSSNVPGPSPNPPPPFVPTPSQNPVPPYVPAPGMLKPQDAQQQRPNKPQFSYSTSRLACKYCQSQFGTKPEILQFEGHAGLFCSQTCCDAYKRDNNVKAMCDYCKLEKIVKYAVTYEKQPRSFCCEGCKLLFKHELTKRFGSQCRTCAYCKNMTHKTIQNFFGGKLEEFCTEECMSLYTVLFYEMAKCDSCKKQRSLKENLVWDGSVKHFCNLSCLMQFCSKGITPHQPASVSTASTTTTAQAPLSLSRDMPVIGGVVSLASTLPGNTALTGALPTSNASSKTIGEASTQTDAAMPSVPYRRTLKNKALMCRPITEEQSVQCDPEPSRPPNLGETVIDENGEKVRLVPVPVPIPVPVYIPVPMNLYTQYTPFPLGLPLPVPVPLVIPGSQETAEDKDSTCDLPAQSSVEEEEVEKGKDKPVSHGDQGSTYSGDLESEARSTPFSWADTEDPAANMKPQAPTSELEDPLEDPNTSSSPLQPDLEDDFPRTPTDPGAAKDKLVLTLKRRRKDRDGLSPRKRGRKRSGTEVSGSVWTLPSSSKLNHMYGVKAWASWVQTRTAPADSEQDQQSSSLMTLKEDVLECSSTQLSYGLFQFIKDVRRPNGEAYEPDSIYYLCLGIQQHLLENGRLENIFTDSLYSQFITEITTLLKQWGNALPSVGYINSRVEEEYLWECKQLGALSPIVLLNTLLFFGSKLLNLKTVEQHQCLAFSNVSHCTRITKNGKSSYLGFRLPGTEEDKDRRAVKRRKEDEVEDEEVMEMPENTENPLRCPVRLYEFYLSKCSDSVKQRPDLFYLQPEISCHPSSPVWYSAEPLENSMMDSMLTRILAVRDVHLDSKQQKNMDSSDEESSQ